MKVPNYFRAKRDIFRESDEIYEAILEIKNNHDFKNNIRAAHLRGKIFLKLLNHRHAEVLILNSYISYFDGLNAFP